MPQEPALVVIESEEDWAFAEEVPSPEVVLARDYLAAGTERWPPGTRVLNLCRRFGYLKLGYYVSLLADARGHRVEPDVITVQDLKSRSLQTLWADEVEPAVRQELEALAGGGDAVMVRSLLGRCIEGRAPAMAREVYERFPAPYVEVSFARGEEAGSWVLEALRPRPLGDLPEASRQQAAEVLRSWSRRPTPRRRPGPHASFDLGIVVDPEEVEPPSNSGAIERFLAAAENVGFRGHVIGTDVAARVDAFDALLLRVTTAVHHPSYRLARRAEARGVVVIDDATSIFRCCNKVYVAEALQRAGIPQPPTLRVDRARVEDIVPRLGLPCVLKAPDSAFSKGVFLADDEASARRLARRLLERATLVIAQGFVESSFDWRVGVFAGRVLYVCRYHMAPGHWQVVARDDTGQKVHEGDFDALRPEDAPPEVITLALAAAAIVGDGFYGVDLKEGPEGPVVVEVNDNPSVDAGVEDSVAGFELYRTLLRGLRQRVERRRDLLPGAVRA